MGCCLSRTSTPSPNPPHVPKNRHTRTPPPPLEEETVKEVLTETPFPETTQPTNNINRSTNKAVREKQSFENAKTREDSVLEIVELEQKQRIDGFEIEIRKRADIETSEITAASENRSVAAAAVAAAVSVSVSVSEGVSIDGVEKRGRRGEGAEEVMSKSTDRVAARRQRSTTSDQSPARVLKRRPYSGEQTINGVREKRVRSPAKRTVPGPAPSPEKKTNAHLASRAMRGRSQSPATSNPRSGVNPAGPARTRLDSGERSGRRSRSPARVNRAGTLTEVNDGQRKQEEVRKTGTVQEAEDEACRPADESLDNPLVSLECFIFL